jgi:HD-GYP domain-containing protein (c-di-GMP phosphodiesterase class II)
MAETSPLTRSFVLLASTTFGVAVVLLTFGWRTTDPQFSLLIVLIAVIAALSEQFAPLIGGYSISLALPLTVCALLLWGPVDAAIVAGASVVSAWAFSSRRAMVISMFNMGQLVVVTLVAGWTYLALGGRLLSSATGMTPLVGADFPSVLVPLLACVSVLATGNVVMAMLGVSTLYGRDFKDAIASVLSQVPSLAALAAVGVLMAQVTATSVAALLLFIFPLIVARDMYQRFRSLKDAYADTIRSLVGALEAKDVYTRGHSERVAGYAVALGRAMGLDAKACDRLEYAGLLHDLGKIALPVTILTKPGALTDAEMDLMKGHPAAGASMVSRIPPLAELDELVRYHHERYEGGGYPEGLAGTEVPALSRILTVADAYDAMTTTRAYRPRMSHESARDVVAGASGTQFDPEVVAVFLRNWSEVVGAALDTDAEDQHEAESRAVPAAAQAGEV